MALSSKPRSVRQPSVRRSLGFLASGTVFAQGIQFAASLILTRLYTPAEFGQYASILAIASVLGAVITMSYQTAIPLAEDDEESRVVAWLTLATSAMAAAFITVAFTALVAAGVQILGWQPDWQHVLFVPLTALSIATWGTLQYRQARLGAFHRVAVATGSGAATQVGSQIGLGLLGSGAPGLSAGYLTGRVVNTLFLSRGARIGRPPGLHRLRQVGARWSQMPKWQLPTVVLNMLATTALTPWVAHVYGLSEAGSFAFALQMLSVPVALVGQAFATILFPRLAEADREEGIPPASVEQYVKGLASVAFPAFLPVLILGPQLFALVFGSEWTQAGQIAALLTPYLALTLVTSPISSIPVVKRRLCKILLWAAIDTAARFAAISLGATLGSAGTGILLYSAVGTISTALYLAWILRLSQVRVRAMLGANSGAWVLAAGSATALLFLRHAASLPVLLVLTVSMCCAWTLLAIRGLRR